ncbi:MAG: hypothetical protein ACKO8Z_14955 [Prosthecobacter sp.]
MRRFWLFILPVVLMASCTRESALKALVGPQIFLCYDDFGPESMASHLLGPRTGNTSVTIHHGSTRCTLGYAHVNALQAMNYLRHQHRHLPRSEEFEPLRQTLASTYSRIYILYRHRRDAMMGGPGGTYGRMGINRTFILPPMPPSL